MAADVGQLSKLAQNESAVRSEHRCVVWMSELPKSSFCVCTIGVTEARALDKHGPGHWVRIDGSRRLVVAGHGTAEEMQINVSPLHYKYVQRCISTMNLGNDKL